MLSTTTRAARAATALPSALHATRAFPATAPPATAAPAGHELGRVSVSAPGAGQVGAPIQRGGAASKGVSKTVPQFARGYSSSSRQGGSTDIEAIIRQMQLKAQEAERRRQNRLRIQQSGVKSKTMTRFLDVKKPQDYMSPVERGKGKEEFAKQLESVTKYGGSAKSQRQLAHEKKEEDYEYSPFVSMAKDPLKAVLSGSLDDITSSTPNLSVFQVPGKSVLEPISSHSQKETEHLYEGENLDQYETHTTSNPFKGGNLRLSKFTPELIDAIGQKEEDEK